MYIMVEYYILVTVIAAIGSFIGSSQCIRNIHEQNRNSRSSNKKVAFKDE